MATNWALSEAAMEHEPLSMNDPALKEPVINLTHEDTYENVIKQPCITIAMKKQSKDYMVWGSPFVNI
ncbi:hypothetical protein BdWA1_002964 [Babesia duncani]|uniref:Uncharacterized protein n=1 Tax=Babesia duncani TaxID=323732 RepID=A0AAD9PIP2_9APIC|nr:hypothetical protein BdWA1_002964 [Babesia duncani]